MTVWRNDDKFPMPRQPPLSSVDENAPSNSRATAADPVATQGTHPATLPAPRWLPPPPGPARAVSLGGVPHRRRSAFIIGQGYDNAHSQDAGGPLTNCGGRHPPSARLVMPQQGGAGATYSSPPSLSISPDCRARCANAVVSLSTTSTPVMPCAITIVVAANFLLHCNNKAL